MAKVNWQTATPEQKQKMNEFLAQNHQDAASMGLTNPEEGEEEPQGFWASFFGSKRGQGDPASGGQPKPPPQQGGAWGGGRGFGK